jgi:hypothetical protein
VCTNIRERNAFLETGFKEYRKFLLKYATESGEAP